MDSVVAGCVDLEIGLFANDGSLRDLGVGRLWPFAFGWIGNADEDLVPVGAGPASPFAVAGDPLLLRAGGNIAIDESVGHPSSTGPAPVLMENDVALHVHAAERSSLRDGPFHHASGRSDGEVFD